jgi:hypothetical protein
MKNRIKLEIGDIIYSQYLGEKSGQLYFVVSFKHCEFNCGEGMLFHTKIYALGNDYPLFVDLEYYQCVNKNNQWYNESR